jgi:hypothetical protein
MIAKVELLESTSKHSAKAITYTTALLGMAALFPSIQLPAGLEVIAGGLGVNIIASLLDRIAHDDDIPEDEIQRQVESAISESSIDKLLTKDSFFHAYSHLLKSQRNVASTADEVLKLLRRLENNIIPTTSGVSYTEARQVAQDVFDANMYRLAGDAFSLAQQRVGELINGFLERLLDTNASAISSASDPDFQYVLFLAQQAYARSGDQELFDVLVDLLPGPMNSSTCSGHAVHLSERSDASRIIILQVVGMGKGESDLRRDSPFRASR